MSDRRDPLNQEGLTEEAARDVRVVAKGGAVQIFGQVMQRSLSFFFTALAIHLMGRAGYGVYRVVAQVLGIAAQLGLAGFNYAAMRFITRARATGNAGGVRGAARVGVAGAAIGSAVVVVAVLIGAGPLAERFPDVGESRSDLAALFRLTAPYVPLFALLQVLRYCTQAYKTMVPSVVAGNIVQPGIRFVLGVSLLLAGFGAAAALTTLMVSVAVAAVLAGWYFRRLMSEEERTARPVAPVGAMVRFALPQGGASLLGVQSLGLGILVLGAYSGDVAVTLFSAALSLQGMGAVFLGGIVNIWAPVVSDLHSKGAIDRLESLYQTINRWTATFSFPVFAALIIAPDVFLELFFPKATGAASAVAILAAGNLFYTGTGPTGYVLSMTGRPGVNLANSAAGVALYLGLGAWLVPRHGVVGMAVVDAIVTALVNTARVIEAKVLVGVQPFGRSFLKPVVATLAGAGVLLAWRALPGDVVWVDAGGVVVAAIVYLWMLKRLGVDAEERVVLDGIRRRAAKTRAGLPRIRRR
ncbi:MAG TPA: oligosaccharide flippase family protein [Actinomycetota bacterium]|nr:oligosaccharide flippase family protein [Actinomycetota bacterium]